MYAMSRALGDARNRAHAVETVLALPERVAPPRHVRSTILVASLDNLRARGSYEKYVQLLAPEHRATLVDAIVGTWIPIEVAAAPYAAGARRNLSVDEQLAMGKRALERIGMSMVGTAMRMAKQSGATPWTFIPHLQRFWRRGYDGGAVGAWRVGPKDARFELANVPLCDSPFFRTVLRGWVTAIIAMFSDQTHVREAPVPPSSHRLTFLAQWV